MRGRSDGCAKLASIDLPDGLTRIGSETFANCVGLQDIILPLQLVSVESWTFDNCINLASIDLPDKLTSIGYKAFNNCVSLQDIILPEQLVIIDDYAFYNCTGLTSVKIPDSVTRIGTEAFGDCTAVANVCIGDGIVDVGGGAFVGTVWYEEQPDGMLILNHVLIGYKGSPTAGSELSVPIGVRVIAKSAFRDCAGLYSIEVPEGVKRIPASCFEDCASLTIVNLPDGLTDIGDYAFSGCSSLAGVDFPSGVTQIGSDAFSGTVWFENQPEGFVLVGTVLYKYKGKTNTRTDLYIPVGVTSISSRAFNDVRWMNNLIIPDTVKYVGLGAFRYALPNGVYYVGSKEDWGKITIEGGNSCLTNTIHYNYTGE